MSEAIKLQIHEGEYAGERYSVEANRRAMERIDLSLRLMKESEELDKTFFEGVHGK